MLTNIGALGTKWHALSQQRQGGGSIDARAGMTWHELVQFVPASTDIDEAIDTAAGRGPFEPRPGSKALGA